MAFRRGIASAVTGDRVWSVLIAFHRPGAAVGSHAQRCGDEKRPLRSYLMILLLSRSNAGSARRDRREGSVGPTEGRATVVVAGETRWSRRGARSLPSLPPF